MGRAPVVILCLGLLKLPAAWAQVPACDQLSGEQKKLAEQILKSQHPYDCCDRTLAECLQAKPVCALAWRLAENVCRRVAAKQEKDKIVRGLSRRARSMMSSGKTVKIDLDGVPGLGDSQAPVTIVMYACPRCPFCSKITPALQAAFGRAPLGAKARLFFKTFPVRSHEHSSEAGMGFMTAARLGRFWEFARYSFERFDSFSPQKQTEWAAAVGLDRAAFEKLLVDPELRRRLVANKKEGIVNQVDATPTFFINGRKFFGDMTAEELVDVAEEEYDRIKGVEHRN